MSRIKGRDTQPELILRRGLHREGMRFRLHRKDLPGRPDLVFPKYQAVIFVNGCFWHGHECREFKWPMTRQKFWKEKIFKTRDRDQNARLRLIESNWRVMTVWECALKGRSSWPLPTLLQLIVDWIYSDVRHQEIEGGITKEYEKKRLCQNNNHLQIMQ